MVDLLFTAAALSLSLVLASNLNSVVNHGVNLSETFIVYMGACFSFINDKRVDQFFTASFTSLLDSTIWSQST